ncbi:MAG: transcription-repair coupling factor [Tannerella sp.]|nr:transcription-repair coupling factor [Tannerella sp.]
MEIRELKSFYVGNPLVKNALGVIKRRENLFLNGLIGSAKAVVTSALFSETQGVFLCLMNDLEDAGYFYNDLMQLSDGKGVYFFPSSYHRHIKYGHTDSANEILRTEILGLLQEENPSFIIVSYPDAVAEKVLSREVLTENTLTIHEGEKLDPMFVSDVLDSYGFEQTDYVYEPGQYAIRGSIVDVFSFSNEEPFRVDFFGNEVETIRSFDVETQLSKGRLKEIHVIPEISGHDDSDTCLLELLPSDKSVLVCNDLRWCRERIESLWNEMPVNRDEEGFKDVAAMQKKLVHIENFVSAAEKFIKIGFASHYIQSEIVFDTSPQPAFQKNFDLVAESCKRYISDGYAIYLLTDSAKQAQRIADIFHDRGDDVAFSAFNHTLHDGYIDNNLKICLFTDHQIFGRFHKYNLKSDKARSGKITLTLKELNQFTTGDYIVHIDHGIGQFGGLVRTEVSGRLQEAVKLIYKNNDIIFVSIHALHKLSKYKGKDGEPPVLSKLGTGAWEKMKDRTKKKVKDIARDLIKLYSLRRDQKGFAFSPDSFMQDELEASFIYEDTPDQLKATNDVKSDMESVRPMDRLICGDVGFGKTEIAVRAAFKAVADNKQVAVLVPTTVLAFQHYRTFSDRLKDFPCSIDYISRARTSGDIRKILDRLKSGELNILIGTHRLVGKDVIFKDLGLLVIDEEQKFGVSVKEKLRQMKTNVDTLTMTATPIPRTLQFSLMGARDLSNIHTPPPNRYPIQTEIERFNADVIREAIEFEMSRNGQVFFINNRIQNIYEIEKLIRREIPDARIAIGHGQMEPEKLEKVIIDFVNYEFDVLISTTIMENGIDVPNANTIIINNAHQFGLSELHQLRGRVGRSNRKAFCYLLSPPLTTLTPESRRRLQAISNFSELGSGMHIALQDLDIRGAGNMLGAEQSGFIADLGYETYQKILEEAVTELKIDEFSDIYAADNKEEPQTLVKDTYIESDLELLFPPTYIPNDSERVSIYRELDSIESDDKLDGFVTRLKDRFGEIPPQGEELIRVVQLRRLGKKLGVEKIILKQGVMRLHLISDKNSPYYGSKAFSALIAFVQKYPKICNFREQADRRSLIISQVPDVEKACRYLKEVAE